MRIANDHYLIIDLEATCSDDGSVPREEMEIIEIGAVMMNARTWEFEDEFQSFVRPVRHLQLTDFCLTLTGIAQADVDGGPPYHEAIAALSRWMSRFPDCLFCSWGDYDRKQFHQDCAHHLVEYPFTGGHLNLKAEFARHTGRKKQQGITEALRSLGMKFEGAHHRGLDDARNIARVVRRVCSGV